MRVRLSVFAVALVVVVNAVVLAGVAWNRLGKPEAVLELTERELVMPYRRWAGRESTGVALSIRRTRQNYDWLDRDKLAGLGFDVDRYEGRPRYDWRSVERRLFVVLEFDGPAFRDLVAEQEATVAMAREGLAAGEKNQRQVEAAETALERMKTAGSRLVVIDAATTPERLRQRYSDRQRYAVMRALVRMRAARSAGQDSGVVLRGHVGRLLPGRVHVPRRFHAALRQAVGDQRHDYDAPPRYRVSLGWGRRQEPWVRSVEVMPESLRPERSGRDQAGQQEGER